MIDFIDETEEREGTPLNRSNLMAIQGMENVSFSFADGVIVIENKDTGTIFSMSMTDDNTFVEHLAGEKEITKTVSIENGMEVTLS